jgi:Matrixin
MRPLLTAARLAVVVMAGMFTFLVARRWMPQATPADGGTVVESYGGAVNVDSVRAARLAILRHIAGPDSYLPVMLRESDSLLRRWPERTVPPLRVHLLPGGVPGYSQELREAARSAFVRWERVGGIPMRFDFVNDSAAAEVLVRWIDRFPLRRAGQADIRWDAQGWIVSATLTLATHTSDGLPLGYDAVYTVALHEIGHLFGLGHSDDPEDVMFPTTSVHDITPRDRHTARLLYAVPPGSLRLAVSGP